MEAHNERIWDYSTLDLFLRCRKKYYYRMVRNLETKTISPALDFGHMTHKALEALYRTGLSDALKVWDQYQDKEMDDLRTRENGLKLLNTYAQVYKNEPFKIIDIEIGFAIPIEDPLVEGRSIMYGGRIDALIEWDSQLFVFEHKTTTGLNYNYFEQFRPNMQLDGYVNAAEVLTGRKCSGVIVNALEPWKEVKRVTDKTKKPEDHFARKPILRNEDELIEFRHEVNEIVSQILDCEKRNEFFKTKSACFSYNYNCAYKQLCLYGEDERLINKDYTVSKWEPYKQEAPNGQ